MENRAIHGYVPAAILTQNQNGGRRVKRDMELIRKILLTIEAKEDITPRELKIEGEDALVAGHHMEMLYRAGMIDAVTARTNSQEYMHVLVKDLSWDGHDFLASLKSDTVWSQLKQKLSAAELASLPLPLIKDVGVGLLKAYITQKVGLSG